MLGTFPNPLGHGVKGCVVRCDIVTGGGGKDFGKTKINVLFQKSSIQSLGCAEGVLSQFPGLHPLGHEFPPQWVKNAPIGSVLHCDKWRKNPKPGEIPEVLKP